MEGSSLRIAAIVAAGALVGDDVDVLELDDLGTFFSLFCGTVGNDLWAFL